MQDSTGQRFSVSTSRGSRFVRALVPLLLLALLLVTAAQLILPSAIGAQDELPAGAEPCLDCHDIGPPDPDLDEGAPAPFDPAALLASPHGDFECIDCHQTIDVDDLPHDDELPRVQCAECHDDVAKIYDASLHGKAVAAGDPLAPLCQDCHRGHDVLPASDPDSPISILNIPDTCGRCHKEGSDVDLTHSIPQDSILTNYSQSIHGEGLYKKGLTVTAVCSSCHTAHNVLPHTDPRSSISRDRIAETCTQCHGRIEEVHKQVIRGELWEKQPHMIPACVDCHSPHRIRKVFYEQGMADRDCLVCHSQHDLRAPSGISSERLFVDQVVLDASRHERVACVQCHVEGSPAHERPCDTMPERVDCAICHREVVDIYNTSTHGQLASAGSPDAPLCTDCHGLHDILDNNQVISPTYPRNIPALCGRCHRAGESAAIRYEGEQTEVVEHYSESIHGKGLLESGLTVTATCANCHSAHGELPARDPKSTVHRDNLAATCGNCHRGVYDLFNESIHSPRVSESKEKLPTCSDCHTAHTISRTDFTDFRLEIMDQCGNCHHDIAESYFDTYHGKVSKLGYDKTAKCYDCHGAHNILPQWESRSTLSRENIVETCGTCHPGSNRRFAGYLSHATHHDPDKYPYLYYTFWGMTSLLVGTFAVAGLHTLLWLPTSLRFRKRMREAHAAAPDKYVRRFSGYNSKLHLMVIFSFFALALTGMTLKFSYTGWARVFARLFGGFEGAGLIHRGAAVITFMYFVLHIYDLVKHKLPIAGTFKNLVFGPNSMMFNKRDLKEIGQSIKWFLGKGPRPDYGRWTYWEKFDYFAVFWGVAMIGGTGLLLWFPEFFTLVLPGWMLNVATIIHSDEALLAVGFIFTIHFFNTHFRPEKFPMDPVIFTRSMPLEEMKIDRPREYRELVESGRLESMMMEKPSPDSLRAWRILGFTALGVGMTLIALIIYASLFAYR